MEIKTDNRESKKPSGWKTAGKVFLLLCVLGILGAAVYRIFFVKETVDVTPLSTVSVTLPETGTLERETALIGTRMPGDLYYAVPKTSGEVTKVYVKAGDRVKKGDPLCEIDNQKQIDAAKISLDSAEVQVKSLEDSTALAKTNFARMEALYQAGDISAQSYEQAKSSCDQAEAGLKAAQLQAEAAKLQYDTQVEFSVLTAPADGRLETVDMTVNSIITSSSAAAVIASEGTGKVEFQVTDRLLSSLKAGDAVRIEKQGSVYPGEVTEVAALPSSSTGLYPVEATVEDGGAIPAGASVRVCFVSEKAEEALLLPTACLYYDGGHTYVYTVSYDGPAAAEEKEAGEKGSEENGSAGKDAGAKASGAQASGGKGSGEAVSGETETVLPGNRAAAVHRTEVQTGLSDTDRTEITAGVSASDEVIRTWTAQLYEGARVQVSGGGAQ